MPRLPDYDVLVIRLTPGRGDAYNVEIASAAGARGNGQFAPPSELDIEKFRRTMDPRNRRLRGRSRYLEAATQFGTRLFEGLLSAASVREVYAVARRDANAAGRGLRLTMSLRGAPELASIPWEFLYDSPRFLAKHVSSPVVRFVDFEDPPRPLRVEAPLRILGMISRPKDDVLAALDAEEEQAALERHLRPLIDSGQVTLHWLARATLPALQQEVDYGEDFHIFHYIGHGEYDEESGHGSLILEHDDRCPRRVDGQQLGEILCERGNLRLAVLNTCEAAQTAAQDPLAGVATSLMQFGVPAVVAMQFAITDAGALTFADEFYGALAAGYAVDAAVTQARRALAAASSDVEWGTPVLFMRVADGRLFDVHRGTTPPGPNRPKNAPTDPNPDQGLLAALLAIGQRLGLPKHQTGRPPQRGGLRLAGVLAAAAAFALVLALVLGAADPSRAPDVTAPQPTDILVRFNYSPEVEKKKLFGPLITAFNRERHKLGHRAIFVQAEQTPSGDAADGIARKQLKPTAWSPASQFWGPMMNYRAHRTWAPAASPVLMRSAIVIAMWEQMAKALDYPDRRVGFEQIFKLASAGWKRSIGRPEFGPFRFVHTNPYSSTTGVTATVAEYLFAVGKQRDLQIADVKSARTRAKVQVIERAVAHSADATTYVAEQLGQHGRGYASAVLLGEDTLLGFNRTHRGEPLVAIYPKEGTFFGEHPFIVLDAPWVTPEQKLAAGEFGRYLTAKITPQLATQHNYRPADPHAKLPAERWRELGVDLQHQTKSLQIPEPPVIAAVQRTWRKDRKPANILIALDTSGSMGKGQRLPAAKQGVNAFLSQVAPQDRVGLITFSNASRTVVPLQPFTANATALQTAIRGLVAVGATSTYDTTANAVDDLKATGRDNDINAIVLLTDGNDTVSKLKYGDLLTKLSQEGKLPSHVRLYTIAYGPEVKDTRDKLANLAVATGGKSYVSTEKNIVDVYRRISTFF